MKKKEKIWLSLFYLKLIPFKEDIQHLKK